MNRHEAIRQAAEDLHRQVDRLALQGLHTPCHERDEWVSDDATERAAAAAACQHCPVLAPCRTVADLRKERHHVWGGRDRTVTQRRKERAA